MNATKALSAQIEEIENALRVLLVPATPGEYDLHALVCCALEKAGLVYTHEAPIAPRARVDFLIGRIAVEVKKGKPEKKALLNQIKRYLESDKTDALFVVSQKSVSLPGTVLSKPVRLISLDKLWGVSLP